MRRPTKAGWLGVLLALLGCDRSPENLGTHAPCPAANPDDAPILALDWGARLETYLPPELEASTIGLDYLVSPAPVVDYVRISPDFDLTLDLEAVTLRERCPKGIGGDLLRRFASGDELVSAVVEVGHSETATVRSARVSLPVGSRTLTLATEGLRSGAPEERWWLLFEPGAGSARIAAMPVDLPASEFSVAGLPFVSATVALVQTDRLSWDAERRVAYGPPGFSASWRTQVGPWYGGLLTRWPESHRIELGPILGQDSPMIGGLATGIELSAGQPNALLRVPGRSATGEIRVDCGAAGLRLVSTGFFSIVARAGTATISIEPGEAGSIPVRCTPGVTAAALDLATEPLNGRPGIVAVERQAERI